MFSRKRRRSDLDRQQDQFDQILNILRRMATAMSKLDDGIKQLRDDVAALKTVDDSAVALISGFQAQLAAAVQAALDAGASPAELQSLTDLHTAIQAEKDNMAAAVAANTPAPAPAPSSAPSDTTTSDTTSSTTSTTTNTPSTGA